MRNIQKQILSTAISSTTAYTSSAIDLSNMDGFAISIVTTGTATGSAKLQSSFDDGLTWQDMPSSAPTAPIAISGAGSYFWNVPSMFIPLVRMVYTNATNSGTLSARLCAKGSNAS